jgi:hypothetical protein
LADTSTGPGIKSLIDFVIACSKVWRDTRFMQTGLWITPPFRVASCKRWV